MVDGGWWILAARVIAFQIARVGRLSRAMSPRKATSRKTAGAKRSPIALVLIGVMAVGVAYFAVQGGEYGTTDLWRQRQRLARLQHDVDSLQRQVDSLSRWKKAIETDPLVQERLAREEFGMIRGDKEILYRFSEDGRRGTGDGR